MAVGPRTELPNIQRFADLGFCNGKYVPATKIYDLSWSGKGKHKVGQIMCELFLQDDTPIEALPRTVARKQVERLDSLGYKLLSAFEAEFVVVNNETLKPVFDGNDFGTDLMLAKNSEWLYDAEKHLANAGVNIGAFHAEFSPGQFECCMATKFGIETADDMVVFKQALKEILPEHGCKPTFMTRAFANNGGASGFHFNHSLWDKSGKGVFFDPSKPDNMSDVMRYWIGGIMKHIKALLVLCNPTPNCFRRIHGAWAPDNEDWDIDHRMTSIRLKTTNENSTLIENRLPSSACNPYLVIAATIAAGIDGIINKIEPPPKGVRDTNPPLPNIEESLAALESDEVLVESLGKDFVEWWIKTKRETELSKFGNITLTGAHPEEELEKEREEYFDFI